MYSKNMCTCTLKVSKYPSHIKSAFVTVKLNNMKTHMKTYKISFLIYNKFPQLLCRFTLRCTAFASKELGRE